MAKYWTLLWQIYLCTIIFSRPCFGDTDLNNPTCANNEFGFKSPNGQLTCKPCNTLPKCPSGLGVSVVCGEIAPVGTHVDCVHCVLGKNFSAVYDSLPCQTCQSTFCHENEKIIGSCKVDSDTSKCSGTCKKGFYSSGGGDLKNCQPCSSCLNNASTRVKKCKDDGLLIEKQCEVGSVVPPALPSKEQQLTSKKNGDATEKHNIFQGYKFYGHPAMFSFFLVVIFVLALILAVVVLRRKFRKKTRSSLNRQPEQAPLTEVNVDSGVGETDSYDGTSDLTVVASVRKRKSSASSGGQKVSFSRQNSNSNCNTGSDFSDERSVQSPVAVNELSGENDVFEEKPLQAPERKRTLSGSSGKRSGIFSRQNSNPGPEQKEETPFHKRSNTFSNFSSIFSAQKIGTTDEKTSLLSSTDYNDNDISSLTVALPAETSSAPHRLSGVKIGDLNAETHRLLCIKLNLEVLDKGWRTLAGRMDYTTEQVKEFAQAANPTDKLLDHWGVGEGHDVARLIELVKAMNRDDMVELLESQPDPTKFYL